MSAQPNFNKGSTEHLKRFITIFLWKEKLGTLEEADINPSSKTKCLCDSLECDTTTVT